MAGHNVEPHGSPTVSMIADWPLSRDRDTRIPKYRSLYACAAAPRQELLVLDENRKVSWKGHDAGLAPVNQVLATGLIEPAHCSMPLKPACVADKHMFGQSDDDDPGLASHYKFSFTYSSARSLSASLGTSPQSTSIQSSFAPTSTSSETNTSPATSTSISNHGAVPCRSCSKTFCDTSTRNRHEKLHRPRSFDIACSSCGETFGRNDACLKHIRNLHAGATEGVQPVKITKLA